MKPKAILFIAVYLLFGMLVCGCVRAQVSPPGSEYHLPGLDDNPKTGSTRSVAPEPRVLKKGPLALSDEDRNDCASFLVQPNTGLIRLLPRTNPKSAFAYAGERPQIRGEGSYFSFHYRSHEYGYGSDLELEAIMELKGTSRSMMELPPHYTVSSGFAGADFGMVVNLGDVSLADLTTSDPRMAYLLAYQPPRAEAEARAEFHRFGSGVTVDGLTYKRTLPLEVNATYLLRSINYDVSDVLVAFHVVRQDADSSVVVAWKLLKSYPMTQLARN